MVGVGRIGDSMVIVIIYSYLSSIQIINNSLIQEYWEKYIVST